MQMSFGSLELEQRIRRQSTLLKVQALIDWESMRPLFKGLYKRDHSRAGGQEPFDCLMMFKAIVLGQWHSLSDAKLEEALLVRIDFLQFCGLALMDKVPDETTLCRFRNRLVKAGLLNTLLGTINKQIQRHGLMVKEATGAVLDATLISSAARPNKTITIETDADGELVTFEDGSQPGVVEEKASADPDARWLKKGKRSYFGYRSYVVVDEKDGYVHGVHTAPANESETTHFIEAVESADITASRIYADKGSASHANRSWLRSQKIKSGIMYKATKHKPLTRHQKLANRLISKKRYIVEQCFGTGKRLFKMGRASYMTTAKVNAQVILKSICMNLTKAANKILEIHFLRGVVRPLIG
jgi:IS5 family transposase